MSEMSFRTGADTRAAWFLDPARREFATGGPILRILGP